MALSRHRRDSSLIWPGFVDAVTTLLMVLMFVLTIFVVMQSTLQEQISDQSNELDSLNNQVAQLSQALGLERRRATDLEGEVGRLEAGLSTALAEGRRQEGVISGLRGDLTAREGELSDARARISDFEAQVLALIGERDGARAEIGTLTASVAALEEAEARMITESDAMRLALAKARDEVDAGAEAARLDAARREALETLLADMRARGATDSSELDRAKADLSEAEALRLADAAALEALRARLEGAETELNAMTLNLEAERQRAEETLTLLAAARQVAETEDAGKSAALREAERLLTEEQGKTLASARELELLNRQMSELRSQMGSLQSVLGEAEAAREAAQLQVESLGADLNAALAQVAAEQRRRAEAEEAERKRLEAENLDLERFRSEFFGQLSQLLAGRQEVRIVGDRFVFSSEVLFRPGSADLSDEGRRQIGNVAQILNEIRNQIPSGIDWIIRVDGHTDNVPLSGAGAFRDNWELSQARALAVVRYMQNDLGFPPDRLAATGFGEYRPVAEGDSEAARAQNRRIELKLTER